MWAVAYRNFSSSGLKRTFLLLSALQLLGPWFKDRLWFRLPCLPHYLTDRRATWVEVIVSHMGFCSQSSNLRLSAPKRGLLVRYSWFLVTLLATSLCCSAPLTRFSFQHWCESCGFSLQCFAWVFQTLRYQSFCLLAHWPSFIDCSGKECVCTS